MTRSEREMGLENEHMLDEQDTTLIPESALDFAAQKGLVPTSEPETERNGKKLYRKKGFDGVVSIQGIKNHIAEFLKDVRDRNDLSQTELSSLLGISAQVWGRYERAVSSLEVTRLVVLCEQLSCNPVELLGRTSPHLFGKTPESANARVELALRIGNLPDEVCVNLLEMVKQIEKLHQPL